MFKKTKLHLKKQIVLAGKEPMFPHQVSVQSEAGLSNGQLSETDRPSGEIMAPAAGRIRAGGGRRGRMARVS